MAPITWECFARVPSTLLPPVCFERYDGSWDITAGRSLFSYSGGFGGRDRTPGVTARAGCGTVLPIAKRLGSPATSQACGAPHGSGYGFVTEVRSFCRWAMGSPRTRDPAARRRGDQPAVEPDRSCPEGAPAVTMRGRPFRQLSRVSERVCGRTLHSTRLSVNSANRQLRPGRVAEANLPTSVDQWILQEGRELRG